MDAPTAKPAPKRRRQRSPSPPAPRKKSCEACRKAKARCNTELPACSRCRRKGVACDYGGTRNEDRPAEHSADTEIQEPQGPVASFTISAEDFAQVDMMLEDPDAAFGLQPFKQAHVVPMPGQPGVPTADTTTPAQGQNLGHYDGSPQGSLNGSHESDSGPDGGWGCSTSDTDASTHGFPDIAIEEPRHVGPLPTPRQSDERVRQLPFNMITTYREDGSKQVELYPNENAEEYNPRFFGFTNASTPACALSTNRVIGAFKIWPKRMVRGDDLPPFIHPHFPGMRVSSIGTMTRKPLGRMYFGQPPKLPEALANCQSICTMFYNKTPENAAFVWKNIKREQERIYANFKSWDLRDCLSSYQAMLIYSFLRMIDGEHEYNNFDMAFILTISEVSAGMWSREIMQIQERTRQPEQTSWQEWMLAESACRTGLVYTFMFIIVGLYKVIPPTKGCRGIYGMPLPCGRKLWNARDEQEWEQEYRAYRESRKSDRILTFEHLKKMRSDSGASITPEERADIEAWAADLDEFGNLVLIGGLAGPGSKLEDYRRTYLGIHDNVA